MEGEELLKEDYIKHHFSAVLSTTWLVTAYLSIKTLEEKECVMIKEMISRNTMGWE